jgi:hypothetical protein
MGKFSDRFFNDIRDLLTIKGALTANEFNNLFYQHTQKIPTRFPPSMLSEDLRQ